MAFGDGVEEKAAHAEGANDATDRENVEHAEDVEDAKDVADAVSLSCCTNMPTNVARIRSDNSAIGA